MGPEEAAGCKASIPKSAESYPAPSHVTQHPVSMPAAEDGQSPQDPASSRATR